MRKTFPLILSVACIVLGAWMDHHSPSWSVSILSAAGFLGWLMVAFYQNQYDDEVDRFEQLIDLYESRKVEYRKISGDLFTLQNTCARLCMDLAAILAWAREKDLPQLIQHQLALEENAKILARTGLDVQKTVTDMATRSCDMISEEYFRNHRVSE